MKLFRDKGFRRDASQQAKVSFDTFPYADNLRGQLADGLSLFAAGGFDPVFRGTCEARACRIKEATVFAQTIGLYADYVVVPDALTVLLSDPEKRLDEQAVTDIEVLSLLRPLIDSGVLRFAAPFRRFCAECAKNRQTAIADAASRFFELIVNDLNIQVMKNKVTLEHVLSVTSDRGSTVRRACSR